MKLCTILRNSFLGVLLLSCAICSKTSAQSPVPLCADFQDSVRTALDSSDELTENVPPAPQNVRGPHEVCSGSSEYYMAEATSDDYIILWEWDNGQPDLAQAVGERVMVTFDAGAADISVYQVDRRTGCRSDAVVWHTYPFAFEPWPYPPQIRVCEGQTFDLDLLPDHPDVPVLYEWKTPEPLAYTLTVVGDHLQRNVQVMTNYLGHVMQVPLYLPRALELPAGNWILRRVI